MKEKEHVQFRHHRRGPVSPALQILQCGRRVLSQFGTVLAVTYFQSKNESGVLSEVDSESSLKKKSSQTLEIWNHIER